MKKFLVSSVLAGMLCVTMANAEVYATVDGQKITDKDMEFFKQVIPGFDFSKLNPQDKEMAISQLIERKLALLAAKQEDIQKDPDYQDALETIKNNLAIDLWVKKQQKKIASTVTVSSDDVKNFYNSNKNLFIEQQAQARMIVVKTKAEAEKIIAELKGKKGKTLLESFIKLANTKSIDPGVQKSQNGGDLGTVNRNQMLPQFTEIVFNLKPGSITLKPIETEAGFHIIYLESKTEPKTITLKQAEGVIENNLKNQKIAEKLQAEMKKLREKAKIQIEAIK